jgi:hypothetical protein
MGKQSESDEENKKEILQTDPEWNDHVMSFFAPDELVGEGRDAKPKVAGLRRVTELLIGTIVKGEVKNLFHHPDDTPIGKTFAVYEVTIQTDNKSLPVVYSDAADSSAHNTDSPFEVFGAAMAVTRAEARALRKALKLRQVAAEECSKLTDKKHSEKEGARSNRSPDDDHRLINADQERYITSQCEKLGVDVVQFINSGENTYPTIKAVPHEIAKKMTQRINEYKQGVKPIPEEIKKGKE